MPADARRLRVRGGAVPSSSRREESLDLWAANAPLVDARREAREVVNIGAAKAEATLASLPADSVAYLARELSQILRNRLVPTESFLSLTLGNPGQFIHPGLMYGHFHLWKGERYDEASIPMFYAGATDEMGEIVERLSSEAIAVAAALKARSKGLCPFEHVQSVHDWLRSSYADVTADLRTVAACFRTGPIQARRAPMTRGDSREIHTELSIPLPHRGRPLRARGHPSTRRHKV